MEKLLKRRNKVLLLVSLIFTTFFSCVENAPTNFTSIKGGWRCIESSSFGERTYLINIEKINNNRNEYLISNFHNVGEDGTLDVKAVLTGSILTLSDQALGTGQQLKSGGGMVDSTFKQMTINYVVTNGSSTIGYSALFTR